MSRHAARPSGLPAVLEELHTQRYTGTVLVAGPPGGRIHLSHGRIGAVETPGAPSAETILRNSGRLAEDTWTSLCVRARANGDEFAAGLAEHGSLSHQEFDLLCAATLFDGAFAMALGALGSWEVTEAVPFAWAGPRFSPQRVTTETNRRIALLAAVWDGLPAELARTAFRPAPQVPTRVPHRYAMLLRAVNGRRTPRDIAFALGRGAYAVMLDLVRMDRLGLLQYERPTLPAARPSTAPRGHGPQAPPGHPPTTPGPALPRRTPGAQHPHRTVER
ncbi:hypothetical protein AB0D30_31165 [Streptomyces sp. NPDC048409]|uniref:hypothetical protein n=1 Tax=Streptomyces sp. NPDC048409 TaxID=3154723 RepID=UPI00341C57D3